MGFDPWVGKIPCRREWQPTPVFLPLKSHGQRSLAVAKTWTWLSGSACTHTHTHTHISCIYCKEKAPFQGPRVGSRLTFRNELSEETQVLTEQETSLGRGAWGEWWGEGAQEDCSATWLLPSGFMERGLVSRLSLDSQSDSESFLVACASLCKDGFQWERFWQVGRSCGLEPPLSFWPFLNSSSWW